MARRLRRRGRVRSLLTAVVSLLWAYAWMVPLVVALRTDASGATAILLGTTALFIGLYVVRPLRSNPRMAAQLRLRRCGRYLPWLTVAAAMKLIMILSTLALHEQLAAQRLLPKLPDDSDVVSAAFLADPFGPVALFLAIGVMAPLIEEFAFRGRMQHALEHAFGFIPAIGISAVVFSVLHGKIDAIHHLASGLFAGWVVWRTGSIWTAVYVHALNNAAAQLLMHLSSDWVMSPSDISSRLWPYAIAAGVLALGGLIFTGAQIHRLVDTERPRLRRGVSKRSLGVAVPTVP
jgi:membrane protease YdiL (CAAX protease family)